MTTFLKTHKHKWIAPILLGGGLILVAVILFASRPSTAKPPVTWTPSSVTETIAPGETLTISVSFTPSKDLSNVVVRVVPELQPFVLPMPESFVFIEAGETTALQLILSFPIDMTLGTFEGTIKLRSGNGEDARTFARPLPVAVVVELERVTEPISGVSFDVPPTLETRLGEDSVLFFDRETPTLPPLFAIYIIDTPPDLSALPLEEVLEMIANNSLGLDLIGILGFRNGGIDVDARTFTRRHFFLYDSASNRAIEITGMAKFFDSAEFAEVVDGVEF